MTKQTAFCTGGEVGLRISASGTYPPELDTLPPVFVTVITKYSI